MAVPLLSCRFLVSVASVNSFTYAQQSTFSEGDSLAIYLQLVDQNQDDPAQGYLPAYRRHCPAPGSTLRVTLRNLDAGLQVTKTATQPFPGDASIWSFPVTSADQLRGTISLTLDLLESGSHLYANVQPALAVRAKL